MPSPNEINLEEGTINFWIKKDKFDFLNNNIYRFIDLSTPRGSILIIKDSDKKLKFFHVLLGKGRTDVEIDVSKITNNKKKHMITATWSLKNKKIALYLDGGEIQEKNNILYD